MSPPLDSNFKVAPIIITGSAADQRHYLSRPSGNAWWVSANTGPIWAVSGGCSVTLDDGVGAGRWWIFIKMDIEGPERAAMHGMQACVKRNKVFLQIELFAGNFGEVTSDLAQMGMAFVCADR